MAFSSSGTVHRSTVTGTRGMVASAHPLATLAGVRMLLDGGNAFDAAVAAGMTLQVCEPHLNGPGGDMPGLIYRADQRKAQVICGQGVAPAGAEISTRPFQLVTGRSWRGTAFGGARGRTDVPKIVDWYMDGKINIDDLITHVMPIDKINEGFDLMHAGKSIRSVVTFD